MKAVVNTERGGPEVLEVRAVPAPQPADDEVLVDVEAVGLNFADILATRGKYAGGPEPPFVGGREFAGTLPTGERVMGYAESGAFAEQIAAKRHRLWPLPEGWTFEQGAAFPVNYFTAYLVYWKAGLAGNDADPQRPIHHRPPRALIHAVAGGVGTAAVQIGKLLGIETYGTSSSDAKLQGAFELGMTHGINYTRQDYEQLILEHTKGEGVDCVFDMLGGEDSAKSIRCLALLGRSIQYGSVSGKPPQLDLRSLYNKSSSLHGFWLSRTAARTEIMQPAWERLSGWIKEGKLKPVVGQVMPLEQIAEAYRRMSDRQNFGKIVLKIKD
jgi:NADPH2:quinone reductase